MPKGNIQPVLKFQRGTCNGPAAFFLRLLFDEKGQVIFRSADTFSAFPQLTPEYVHELVDQVILTENSNFALRYNNHTLALVLAVHLESTVGGKFDGGFQGAIVKVEGSPAQDLLSILEPHEASGVGAPSDFDAFNNDTKPPYEMLSHLSPLIDLFCSQFFAGTPFAEPNHTLKVRSGSCFVRNGERRIVDSSFIDPLGLRHIVFGSVLDSSDAFPPPFMERVVDLLESGHHVSIKESNANAYPLLAEVLGEKEFSAQLGASCEIGGKERVLIEIDDGSFSFNGGPLREELTLTSFKAVVAAGVKLFKSPPQDLQFNNFVLVDVTTPLIKTHAGEIYAVSSSKELPSFALIRRVSAGPQKEALVDRQALFNNTSPLDLLEVLYSKQHSFQERMYPKGMPDVRTGHTYDIAIFKDMVLASVDESMEILGSVPWKPWKKNQELDLENLWMEIIDLQHFLFNLAIFSGMTVEDYAREYLKKHKENHARQDRGY